MPYQLQKSGSGYVVVNPATGRKHSNRPMSRTRAVRQMRALYAAESKSYPDQRQFAGYTMEDWDDTKPDSFYHAIGKDAGTAAGPMLSGPGGLLGTPGMGRRGRKWGKRRIRTKAQSAQDRAIFAKLGKGGGKGGGGGSKLWPKNDEGKRVPPGGKKDEITAENVKINATVENGRYGKRHTYKIDGLGDNFLTTTHRVDGLRSVSTFHLPPEARGKGIGQQMLLRALRDGDIAKESGNGVSDAYRRVQDSLIRKGKVKVHKDEYDNSIMSLSAKGKTKSYAGRKWGNRRKSPDCTCGVVTKGEQIAPGITRIRGNLCNVHGRYGPCDAGASAARKPKGKKGRAVRAKKPLKTPEQRLAERQQAQAENRSKVFSQLGLPEDAAGALEDLRSGIATDDDGGLVKMGLAEQAADGSYRLTPAGRALANAASQGDVGRARDMISGARDRLGARESRRAAAEQRKLAAEQRKQEVVARRAEAEAARKKRQAEAQKKRGSGSKQTGGRGGEDRSAERAQREAERQADRARRLREHEEDRSRRQREHEADRAARELERQQRGSAQQQPAQTATAPAERVSGTRPGVVGPSRKRGRLQRTNVGTRSLLDRQSQQ